MPKSSRSACRRGLFLVVGLLLASGCDVATSSAGGAVGRDRPVKVLATTGMIGDIASRVGGADAQVESLMGPGVDPHLYKASEGDVRRFEAADLILYNGLNLEGKLGDLFVKLSRTRAVLAVSEDIPRERLREPPEFQGHFDPHIWFDVGLWSAAIDPIARELSRLDPAHAAGYAERAAAVKKDLGELDAWVEKRIAEIPRERRVLVTAHDAFGYFGRRYGIDIVTVQGISTASEASIADIERVADVVVARKVKAVFVESSVPRRTIDAVLKACASRGQTVQVGGELFSDALGASGTRDGTYRGMVEHNVDAIVEALR